MSDESRAVDRNFTSNDGQETNVADDLDQIARALWCLGRRDDKAKPEAGAVEFLALVLEGGTGHVCDALRAVADGLNNVAAAIREK